MVVPAGKGHLLINAPKPDYVVRPIAVEELSNQRLGDLKIPEEAASRPQRKPSFYPDAWIALDLKPGSKQHEVNVVLRRNAAR